KLIAGLAVSGDGGELSADGALVVGGAAGEQTAVAARQLPGIGKPLLLEVNRLDVVVGIKEDGRFAGGLEPFAVRIWKRVADAEHLDVVEPSFAHLSGRKGRRAVDLRGMFAVRADARNGDQLRE